MNLRGKGNLSSLKPWLQRTLYDSRPEKALRNRIKRWLKEKVRGLPPGFIFRVSARKEKGKFIIDIEVPAWAEANPVRLHQLDLLMAQLEELGLTVNVFYREDLPEKEGFLDELS